MAYTGILLRGDTFANVVADPPINREVAMAGEWFGTTTMGGNTFYLNLAELSKIGKSTDNSGGFAPGIKTSELAITFDGGLFDKQATAITVNGSSTWRFTPLHNLEQADENVITVEGVTMYTPGLSILSFKPTIDALDANEITVSFSKGTKALVKNETTGTDLGEVATSGGTLTFSAAQNSGDHITARVIDADYNYSLKSKGTV